MASFLIFRIPAILLCFASGTLSQETQTKYGFMYESVSPQRIITGCRGTDLEKAYYIVDGTGVKKEVQPGSTVEVIYPFTAVNQAERKELVPFVDICFPAQCKAPSCGNAPDSERGLLPADDNEQPATPMVQITILMAPTPDQPSSPAPAVNPTSTIVQESAPNGTHIDDTTTSTGYPTPTEAAAAIMEKGNPAARPTLIGTPSPATKGSPIGKPPPATKGTTTGTLTPAASGTPAVKPTHAAKVTTAGKPTLAAKGTTAAKPTNTGKETTAAKPTHATNGTPAAKVTAAGKPTPPAAQRSPAGTLSPVAKATPAGKPTPTAKATPAGKSSPPAKATPAGKPSPAAEATSTGTPSPATKATPAGTPSPLSNETTIGKSTPATKETNAPSPQVQLVSAGTPNPSVQPLSSGTPNPLKERSTCSCCTSCPSPVPEPELRLAKFLLSKVIKDLLNPQVAIPLVLTLFPGPILSTSKNQFPVPATKVDSEGGIRKEAAYYGSLPRAVRTSNQLIYYPSCEPNAFQQPAVFNYCKKGPKPAENLTLEQIVQDIGRKPRGL